jgi:hypothetical protein
MYRYALRFMSVLSPDRRTNFQPGPKPGPEPGPVLLLCTVHVHPTKIGS